MVIGLREKNGTRATVERGNIYFFFAFFFHCCNNPWVIHGIFTIWCLVHTRHG